MGFGGRLSTWVEQTWLKMSGDALLQLVAVWLELGSVLSGVLIFKRSQKSGQYGLIPFKIIAQSTGQTEQDMGQVQLQANSSVSLV